MRHQKRGYKLGRTPSHRKATLAALSNALIQHKQITTTWVKAKALRSFVEPIINRAKEDSTNNRRQVFRVLQDKESVKELFGEIAEKIDSREGGYTRIVKAGHRKGDGAEMAVIELVDYNDVKPEGASGTTKKRTRRAGRRRKSSDETATVATAAPAAVEATEEIVEEAVEVTEESVSEVAEESSEAAESVIETATETVEEVVEEIKDVADKAVEKVAEVVESASEVVEDVVEEVVGSDETKETSDGEEAPEDEEKKEGE